MHNLEGACRSRSACAPSRVLIGGEGAHVLDKEGIFGFLGCCRGCYVMARVAGAELLGWPHASMRHGRHMLWAVGRPPGQAGLGSLWGGWKPVGRRCLENA